MLQPSAVPVGSDDVTILISLSAQNNNHNNKNDKMRITSAEQQQRKGMKTVRGSSSTITTTMTMCDLFLHYLIRLMSKTATVREFQRLVFSTAGLPKMIESTLADETVLPDCKCQSACHHGDNNGSSRAASCSSAASKAERTMSNQKKEAIARQRFSLFPSWSERHSKKKAMPIQLCRRSLIPVFVLLAVLFCLPGAISQLSPPKLTNFKCLSNGCCDQHEWCRFWASIGECRTNADWMTSNCQLACNTCHVASTPASSAASTSAVKPPRNSSSSAGGLSCAKIAETLMNVAPQMLASKLVDPVEDTTSRTLLSIDDVTRAVSSGCVPQLSPADCSRSLCYHLMYRTLDGACNNLRKPLNGAAFRPYLRHLPPEYDNGFSEPVSSMQSIRPSVREASRVLLSSAQSVTHDQFNSLLMQWGQFMSHDMAKTTLQPTANCASCEPVQSKCVPVSISDKDTNDAFKQKKCLKISRSAPVCGTGTTNVPRQQLNENTAYVDGSQIYGSSSADLHKFRDGSTGLLKMSRFNSLLVLPFDHSKCSSATQCTASFTAGDIRANLFIGLSSMHILFAREHNRVATALQRVNPSWDGDRLFQEARKVVGAEIQHILYTEFLPKILGSSFDKIIGPFKRYDADTDSTISNVFTTSAYRFGHGMILESYPRLTEDGQSIPDGPFQFGDGVFKSNKILFEGGIDPILRGFWSTAVKRPHRMTPSITERMFGSTDLGSLNIMRGREHGIPSYNRWRKFCGLPMAAAFDDLKEQILDESVRRALADNYPSPDDVDLYVGAMVEDPVVGGLVGTTLACIIGDQFKRTRDGDRFYYENPGVFTAEQLTELRHASLARVICDNGDNIAQVPRDAFQLPRTAGGRLTPCADVPQIDLSKWKD